jgi:hypothetical protein
MTLSIITINYNNLEEASPTTLGGTKVIAFKLLSN